MKWEQFFRNVTRLCQKLITFCFPRFSPPISQFTDKISPVCLPQPGDDSKLPIGAHCYSTGKYSQL